MTGTPQTLFGPPSAAPDKGSTELLDADEDGGGGIDAAAGAAGGAMAIALGLLVFCLLRRHRKQKQQLATLESSNVASSSTLSTTVNQTALSTGHNVASGSASSLHVANLSPVWPPRRNPLPTTNVDIHLDLEKDQLKPAVSLASASSLARRAHLIGGGVPRRARIEAAAAAAKDSEASETDEVPRGKRNPQPRSKPGGSTPGGHKPGGKGGKGAWGHAQSSQEGGGSVERTRTPSWLWDRDRPSSAGEPPSTWARPSRTLRTQRR